MLNKVFLIGHLGQDPELRYTASGDAICRFSLATSEKYTKNGESVEKTEWHRIVAWTKLAEICGQYLTKGKQVFIEGKLQTTSWEKDGVRRYTTEIVANTMKMLGNKDAGAGRESQNTYDGSDHGGSEDDLPF